MTAHAQKPDLVFQGNGRVHLNRRWSQFSRLLAAEVCASAVVMVVILDTPCSEVEWKTTGYPLHSPASPSLPNRASPRAIRFQLSSTAVAVLQIGRSLVRSQLVSLEFFININPSDRTMSQESTQPLTEVSTRSISWG